MNSRKMLITKASFLKASCNKAYFAISLQYIMLTMKNSILNLSEAGSKIMRAKVKKDMVDHSHDPFFENKLQAAKKRLERITLPGKLTGR